MCWTEKASLYLRHECSWPGRILEGQCSFLNGPLAEEMACLVMASVSAHMLQASSLDFGLRGCITVAFGNDVLTWARIGLAYSLCVLSEQHVTLKICTLSAEGWQSCEAQNKANCYAIAKSSGQALPRQCLPDADSSPLRVVRFPHRHYGQTARTSSRGAAVILLEMKVARWAMASSTGAMVCSFSMALPSPACPQHLCCRTSLH